MEIITHDDFVKAIKNILSHTDDNFKIEMFQRKALQYLVSNYDDYTIMKCEPKITNMTMPNGFEDLEPILTLDYKSKLYWVWDYLNSKNKDKTLDL